MGGQDADGADAEGGEQRKHLILDHIGQRADDQQFAGAGGGQGGHHCGEAGILALGEGRLDAGTGVVDAP